MTYIRSSNRFGSKPSTVTSFNAVWPVALAEPAYRDINSGDFIQLASASASDTASGAGMRRVHVVGLGYVNDSDWSKGYKYVEEDVWLNGTTPVSTSNKYTRFFRMYGNRGNTNVGTIFVGYGAFTDGVPANIQGQIVAGNGQTTQLVGSFPSSVSAHLTYFNFDSGKAGGGGDILCDYRIRTRQYIQLDDGSFELGPWRVRYIGATIDSLQWRDGSETFVIDGPCDFVVEVNGSGTGARASGTIGYELHRLLQ
jgi:hypothetical protein